MSVLPLAARAATTWVFLHAGVDVVRHPEKPAATAGWLFEAARTRVPAPLPADVTVVRMNAAVQVVAAGMVVTGVAPRPAVALLAGSLIATTVGGHAYWRIGDPVQRKAQRIQFTKNLGLLGGLLSIAAAAGSPHHAKGGRA